MSKSSKTSALLGAAFLMATSAIGPGFITQTTVFTQQLSASLAFVILCSILLDLAAQLNIWRIIAVSGKRANEIADGVLPGMGKALTLLVVFGGLVFNIGNIAGAGLGINILFRVDENISRPLWGTLFSTAFALFIFWVKDAGLAMDRLTKFMGFAMIGLTLYVVFRSNPPMKEVVIRSILPQKIDSLAIITLVGGTVGGYISFAGAHRLLDAGITGLDRMGEVSRSSLQAIGIASLMRILLFLAALGVLTAGATLDPAYPPASVFRLAAGETGYRLFGIVLWCAAITSVVGSAYTSVSFARTLHPWCNRNHRMLTTLFILFSTVVFNIIGQPVKILVAAGAINGLILPVALAMILLAAYKPAITGSYRHPKTFVWAGWLVVVMMSWLGVNTILNMSGSK